MDKDWRVRAGDWEADVLTARQVSYAANDALAAVNVALAAAAEWTEAVRTAVPPAPGE